MKLKHVIAENADKNLELLVPSDADLDGTFLARCLLTDAILKVNGWNLIFQVVGETEEFRIKLTNRESGESYTIADISEAKDQTDKSVAESCLLSGQVCSMGVMFAELVRPSEEKSLGR